MATTSTNVNVNKPTDIKKKEADINRKLQVYGIISAFSNGKVPSNDQIDVALNSFLASRALSSPSNKLSAEGRELVADVRDVVKQAKNLLLSKNEGNLLQDFIWQTQNFDPNAVGTPDAPVDKNTAKRHGDQALEGLRTLGTLLITNGQFRKLLKDATVLFRDMGADAAQKAANKARPDEDALNNLDRPAPDHTWHDTPDISKDNLKNQAQKVYGGNPKEDIKHAANQANQEAHPNGSSDPKDIARTAAHDQATGDSSGVNARGGLQAGANTLKQRVAANTDDDTKETARRKKEEYRERTKQYFQQKVPEERRDQIIFRLKKMVVECQQHPDYQQAITTLLDLAEEYGGHAKNLGQQGTGTAQEARSGFAQAEEDLKTLLERFANGTSSDDLWDAVNVIYRDADRDPELKDWFRSMDRYIRRCLTEEGYILEDESTNEWNRLYDHGNFLLRDKYRGHTDQVVDELKFLGDQFDQDPHNTAFANSLTKLFNDLGQDQNGKPTFKPHLLRDLRDVIIPAIFENAAYIPIPRIEYSDPQFDAVIENLVLESDNFMPNVLEIANENYLRWGRKNIASKNRHGVEVHVAGIQMDLRDVSYYVKRKQGFPSLSDTGLMNILLAGEGFSFKMRMSTPDARDRQNFFKVDKVDVDVHNLNIKLKKSKHKLLFNLFKPIMLKVIRPALQKAVEKAIKDKVHDLDSKLYQVKLEADRAKEEALDNPDQAPNIYNRYATAAQNKFLKGKKKAQEAAADKKVNMAVTKEDSIFPNIHLPGGISSKATEYKELARKGDRWESPVFSIGAASRSSDIPPAPKITRKPHRSANPKDVTHPGNTFDANHNPQQYKSHNDNTYNQTNSSQGTGYGTTQTGYQQSSSGAGYSQGGNQSGAGFNQANPAYGDRYAQDPVLNQAYAERTNNQAPYS
jgi:DNA ligase-4